MAKPKGPDFSKNVLFYGDNLDVTQEWIEDETIDLIYLDPPFNSERTYNVIFKHRDSGEEANAQITAFDDTWTWSQDDEHVLADLVAKAPGRVPEVMQSLYTILGPSDMMSYLVMMCARLIELQRVLKPTGSMYLHCDPTASHYLKVVCDAVLGPEQFRNEIIWRRTGAHTSPRRYSTVHDVLLFYSKDEQPYFNPLKTPYTMSHVRDRYTETEDGRFKFVTGGNILSGPGVTDGESGQPWRGFDPSAKGRHWAIPGYLMEQMPEEFAEKGVLDRLEGLYEAGLIEIKDGAAWPHPVKYLDDDDDGNFVTDIWAYQPGTEGVLHGTSAGIDQDVQWLGPTDPERLGYPTQKPLGLLERIIESCCPPDGVVMDPFCGCGTAVDAAQRLDRRWIGIDISYLAVDLIEKRLIDAHGPEVLDTLEIVGVPRDMGGAQALFDRSPLDFERWAVSLVDGTPNERQVGDRGVDGVIRFPITSQKDIGRVIVSVKGGKQLNPAMVRDLMGTVSGQDRAEMGILITIEPPTRGMIAQANKSGSFKHPVTGTTYPRVQLVTVAELLNDARPAMPTPFMPYLQAQKYVEPPPTLPGI